MSDPVIQVKEGKLKGKICKTSDEFPYFAFKGIPYAKPPVNDLRFAVSTLLTLPCLFIIIMYLPSTYLPTSHVPT